MEQINIKMMVAKLATCFCAVFLFSNCNSDDFFGFEDNSGLWDNNVFNPASKNNDFLDISFDGAMLYASEQDKQIYNLAYERLTITNEKDQLIIKEKSGKEVNISERLFEKIKTNVEMTNKYLLTSFNEKKFKRAITRTKRNSPEGSIVYDGTNCICFAISYFLYGDTQSSHLSFVDNTLRQHYGSTYTNGDLTPSDIPEATGYFGHEANNVQNLPVGYDFRALFCAETGTVNNITIGHVFIIKKLETTSNSPGGSSYYNMYWLEPVTGSEIGPTMIAPSGDLPLTTPNGQTILVPAENVFM